MLEECLTPSVKHGGGMVMVQGCFGGVKGLVRCLFLKLDTLMYLSLAQLCTGAYTSMSTLAYHRWSHITVLKH